MCTLLKTNIANMHVQTRPSNVFSYIYNYNIIMVFTGDKSCCVVFIGDTSCCEVFTGDNSCCVVFTGDTSSCVVFIGDT